MEAIEAFMFICIIIASYALTSQVHVGVTLLLGTHEVTMEEGLGTRMVFSIARDVSECLKKKMHFCQR